MQVVYGNPKVSMSTELAPIDTLELELVQLAREIAMDIRDIETVLKDHGIPPERFEKLKSMPRFRALVESEMVAWNGSLNTQERVKLKAASMLEEYLPELNSRLHDPKETLTAKLEGAKLVSRLAGAGLNGFGVESTGGERFSLTINFSGSKLEISKEVTHQGNLIEGEVINGKAEA